MVGPLEPPPPAVASGCSLIGLAGAADASADGAEAFSEGETDGAGSAAAVVLGDCTSALEVVVVGVGEGDAVMSLVVVVVGAAVAGGATNPSAVVAMASEAKAAESRLRVSPMDIPFFWYLACAFSALTRA